MSSLGSLVSRQRGSSESLTKSAALCVTPYLRNTKRGVSWQDEVAQNEAIARDVDLYK